MAEQTKTPPEGGAVDCKLVQCPFAGSSKSLVEKMEQQLSEMAKVPTGICAR